MKRAREDNTGGAGTHNKRPAGGSAESSEPGHPRLTTQDALQYLKAVKERFKDDNDKYDEFLEVMREFKAQRIDTNGVVAKVKELFKGHNKLMMGFNAFLPKGFEIVLPEETPPQRKQPVEFDQAITFVNKIKNRFQDNEQVYKAFLEILNNYRKGTKSIGDVYQEVATLFCDHADLLDEFTLFLPESSGLAASGGVAAARKEDKTSSRSSFERLPKKEKSQLEERGFVKAEKERRKAERERDRKEERENRDKDDFDDMDGARLPQKRKSARRADELIRKQSQTGETGSTKEHAFFDKIKSRLRNRETYNNLLKILNLFTEQIINRAELQSLVSDILGRYPDLLEGFNDLFSRGDSEGCGAFGRKTENEGVPSKMVKMERDHEREKDRDREKDGREREKDKERDRERERDRDKEKDRYTSKEGKVSLLPSKDKFLNKPISELDLSNCERCTPSYRLLPKSYSRPISSHRNDLANSVLNDNWVSVTSGSEDYSFKHMRRNQYEESLFRCEDDRFELDMLLESTIATAKQVGALIEKLPECDNQIRVDDYFSAAHLRSIERIYGDHGLDIIDLLRKNAPVVLPVIHARLKQKESEWLNCKSDMNKVWAEVYAKNYQKSLDHRSFYFKQQDKNCLNTKALLAEIKEIHEKKRKEDDYILASVMGNRRLLMPDLKFEYPDQSIHEDLFQIMKYSADEVCNTMEQSDKIMRVWTTFLEPMFGVPPRPRGTEDAEEAAKVQAKEGRSSSGESAASGALPKNDTRQAHESATASSKLDALERKDTAGNIDQSGESQVGDVAPLDNLSRRDQNQGQAGKHRETILKNEGAEKESHRTHAKVDREEGELSPSLELDERHNSGEHAKKHRLTKDAAKDEHEEPEAEGDADAEADADDEGDESGQKSSEDTDKFSEPGEEVSGSDSGEPDDASREEHEEEEDGEKAESECEGEGMADADDGEGVGISSLTSSDRLSNACEPLTPYVNIESSSSGSTIFYGTDMFYILFRLHQTLYERIQSAKTNAMAAEQKWKQVKDSSPPNLYEKFVRVLYNLLDGSAENNKFEDECRALIGAQSYVLFTLDNLIFKLLKQLQAIVADDAASKLLALHSYERARRTGGYNDQVYHANVSVLLSDDSVYRFEHKPGSSELLIQLMEGAPEKIDVPPYAMDLAFSRYLDDLLTGPELKDVDHHVFLVRNKKPSSKLDELEALEEAMKDVQLVNGLEHKISTKTSKVSYVLDTEDLFHRCKPRTTATGRSSERRNRKFQDWVDSRLKSLPETR